MNLNAIRLVTTVVLTAAAVALGGCANGNARSGASGARTTTHRVVPNGSKNANPLNALVNNASKALDTTGTNANKKAATSKAITANRKSAAKSFENSMTKFTKSISDAILGDGKGATSHANALYKRTAAGK